MMTLTASSMPLQTDAILYTTEQLIELWLHGKSPNTCDAYKRDVRQFLIFVSNKPLTAVTIQDVQGFARELDRQKYAIETQRRRLGAIKSLLSYGHHLGVLAVNVGRFVKPPKAKNTLSERILSEEQVLSLLNATTNERDYALLRLMYATGARVSEICTLKWQDLHDSKHQRGQVTLFGKGQKTRTVLVSAETWQVLQRLKGDAKLSDSVFRSRTGRPLQRGQVQRIVEAARDRTGIAAKVTPHWFRHAHATHALEHGSPLILLKETLGHASIATTGIYLHVRPQDSSALYLVV